MKLSLTLIQSLLTATTALAAPLEDVNSAPAFDDKRITHPALDVVNKTYGEVYDSNWAGAIKDGHYSIVSGDFTVTRPQKFNGHGGVSTAWVGIDGWINDNTHSILQTGVNMNVDNYGNVIYSAWCEWFPRPMNIVNGISFSPGDEVYLAVEVDSSTAGTCYIENLTNGQKVCTKLPAHR